MKIEAQNSYFKAFPGTNKPLSTAHAATELSAQDKLRLALDEKRWLTESIQSETPTDEPVLGKNLDLRV
jgi:hypothetical protein